MFFLAMSVSSCLLIVTIRLPVMLSDQPSREKVPGASFGYIELEMPFFWGGVFS